MEGIRKSLNEELQESQRSYIIRSLSERIDVLKEHKILLSILVIVQTSAIIGMAVYIALT